MLAIKGLGWVYSACDLTPPEMTPVQDATRRQQAADALLSIADCVAEAGIEPISMEDIQVEEFILKDVAWGLRGQD